MNGNTHSIHRPTFPSSWQQLILVEAIKARQGKWMEATIQIKNRQWNVILNGCYSWTTTNKVNAIFLTIHWRSQMALNDLRSSREDLQPRFFHVPPFITTIQMGLATQASKKSFFFFFFLNWT